MLRSLSIENIAIIQSLRLEPGRGLSILTGETGAGKSILIDALGLALGFRADLSLLRHGSKRAVVEALFDHLNMNSEVRQVLQEAQLDYAGGDVLIRRELNANGKSRAFFNDELIPLSALKIIAANLVEMHGQHENQKIFKPKNHLLYLGKCINNPDIIREYRTTYQHFRRQLNRFQELKKHRDTYLRERELREFHFRELDAIKPEPGELDKMEQELSIMENRERLAVSADQIARTLYEDDDALTHHLEALKKTMQQLLQIDPGVLDSAKELQSALISLSEVGRSMSRYRDELEHDPQKLARLQERTAAIHYQMRKHNMDFAQLCEYYEQLSDEMSSEADYDTRLEQLHNTLEESRKNLSEKALLFHRELLKTADGFAENIEARLKLLGMKHARFRVDFRQKPCEGDSYVLFEGQKVEPTINGIDETEFLIITNPGEDFKPLLRIASGGEVSRIMLAIKSVLAEHDDTPTLIFDEIDAGVSGHIAHVVGEQIRELSKHHQILCITHLPQIAAMGERHFKVDKDSDGRETFAKVEELSASTRVDEIASLLSGKKASEAGRKTAEELLKQA